MFEWLFGHKKGATHILAIDLGTASISAAVVLRSEKAEILKVFRYPIDLFGYQVAGQSAQLPHVLKEGFLKLFKEAWGVSRHLDAVVIGLSDPFFLDAKTRKKIVRPNHAAVITAEEVNVLVKTLESEAALKEQNLAIVGREILNTKINGYEVESANGYKGISLETEIIFTSISATLKEYIESAKEKFFPKSLIYYYSDASVFRKVLKATENFFEPRLIVDIGGEVTGIFLADAFMIQHFGASAFGIRTLARRVTASLKMDAAETDSLLKKYTAGTLDDAISAKISRTIALALTDWWSALQNILKQFAETATVRKMALSGGGADFPAFAQFLKESFKKDFKTDIDIRILRAEAFKDFLAATSQNLLSGGGDIVLVSLTIFAPW